MRFVIRGDVQVSAERPGGIQRESAAPGVQEKVTIRLAETLRLLVVVVAVVTEFPDRAAKRGEVRIHVKTAQDVCGLDREWRVERWFFHHEVDRSCWLGAIHEGRAATHDFHALHRIKRRRVVGLGITNHVGVDRDAILEDLKILSPVWVVASIPDAQQRRVFLGQNQPRRLRDHLPVIVHADVRNLLQIDVRGFLASVDFRSLHIGEKNAIDRAVVVGAHLNLLELLHRLLGSQGTGQMPRRQQDRGEFRCTNCERVEFHESARFSETRSHMQASF